MLGAGGGAVGRSAWPLSFHVRLFCHQWAAVAARRAAPHSIGLQSSGGAGAEGAGAGSVAQWVAPAVAPAAPEALRGKATFASDIYSLGVVLWWVRIRHPMSARLHHGIFAHSPGPRLVHTCSQTCLRGQRCQRAEGRPPAFGSGSALPCTRDTAPMHAHCLMIQCLMMRA